MPTIGSTPNFALALPYGNRQNWTDLNNDNFRILDALIATYVSVSNLKGLWVNSFAYTAGDNVVDESSGVVYTAQVSHTSSALPTTFAQERAAHTTYWLTFAVAARNRGAWQTATAYSLNDFVIANGTKYAVCTQAHTSGANFDTDAAAGKWSVLIDVSTAAVLPVLSGAPDANKALMADSGGNAYLLNSMATLAGLLISAGLAPLNSPALTGTPTSATTPAAETNNTTLANTEYADRAVRNIVIRRQTFSGNGTYTPHAKMIYCDIECWGGGGGGGGSANSGAGRQSIGGGGGAGGYSRTTSSKATIGVSQVVTVGAAGSAGSAGNNAGGSGGTTSVGALCVANGGSGGAGNASSANFIATGGAGGTVGTGDVTGVGQSGGSNIEAANIQMSTTFGGSSSLGGGGRAVQTASLANGEAGTGKASGGSGGNTANGGGAAAGGAGTAGFVCITEYCYG